MNFQLTLNNEKLTSLKGQLNYTNEMLNSNIQEWEKKEYNLTKEVIENNIIETKELIERIKSL
tara:strand:+ start:24800 stop:24988 length:189 start_codon:yes stop_codon:yes gene_type:complete